jgi:hypothetical protein
VFEEALSGDGEEDFVEKVTGMLYLGTVLKRGIKCWDFEGFLTDVSLEFVAN